MLQDGGECHGLNVVLRGRTFYVRKAVPLALRSIVGKRELKVSRKTNGDKTVLPYTTEEARAILTASATLEGAKR